MRVWLCEKPSQAADLARELGGGKRLDGYFETKQGQVTYGFGHLLEDAPPDAYDPRFGESWSFGNLPIIPDRWKAMPKSDGRAQLRVIKGLLEKASEVVIATDPDREGELIGREILTHCGYRGPVRRFWTSSMDSQSVAKAIAKLKDGKETESLAHAAQARGHADWLVGMNCTRAATLTAKARGGDNLLTVGRVQTPTLALVVRRDREIEEFVSREFFELTARVRTVNGTQVSLRHAPSAHPDDLRIFERGEADKRAAQANDARGPLSVKTSRKKQGPPKLFSLSGLQKECNRRFGWSADKTLSIAQSLYETHKATSYPRTDCAFLPAELVEQVPQVLANLRKVSEVDKVASDIGAKPIIRKSVFDTGKVTAHYAITPTLQAPPWSAMSADERKAYVLIAQHYLAALMPDYEYDETRMTLDANGVPFGAVGKVPTVLGWKAAFGQELPEDDDDEGSKTLPAIADGTASHVTGVDIEVLHTKPPAPYTEGTLIEDMKAIAKFAADPAVKARLKETSGIGTEATRASIIKSLRTRKYLTTAGRAGKTIVSTEIGRALVDLVPSALSDAALTAVWEDRLEDIAGGKAGAGAHEAFVAAVAKQIAGLVQVFQTMPAPEGGGKTAFPVRPPTPNMLKYARSVAKQLGSKRGLPEEVERDGAACRRWLDENAPGVSSLPSPKSVEYAKSIAAKRGIVLSEDVLRDKTACKAFLDEHTQPGFGPRGGA